MPERQPREKTRREMFQEILGGRDLVRNIASLLLSFLTFFAEHQPKLRKGGKG